MFLEERFRGNMIFSSFESEFPSFMGKDYDVWAIKMTTTLQDHDV